MRFLPLGVRVRREKVLVVGGGSVAEKKVRKLLQAGGEVILLSPEITAGLETLVLSGAVSWVRGWFMELETDARFVVAATRDRRVNEEAGRYFRKRGHFVCAVDAPGECDFIFPAICEGEGFTLAVTTDGAHPGISRRMREFLEEHRGEVAERILSGKRGKRRREGGRVVLVGAGPGAWDLLTIRALKEIKDADVIVKDYLVPDEVVEKSGTKAKVLTLKRHRYGDREGARKRQDYALRLMERLARKGYRVVRLKSGDPFIFGRGGEEVDYLLRKGIPVSVVPGVTAALGAAASSLLPLTMRGVSSAVIFSTGARERTGTAPFPGNLAKEGTFVAYMSAKNAVRVREDLLASGVSPDTAATIVDRATWEDEKVIHTTVGDFPSRVSECRGPALLIVGEVCRESVKNLEILRGGEESLLTGKKKEGRS